MLDNKTFNQFITKANKAHGQFSVWVYANNEFAKYQEEWNKIPDPRLFTTEEFSRERGCRYKNFWDVVIPTLQHGWVLSVARLFDPPYHSHDKAKQRPRLSFKYVLGLLDSLVVSQSYDGRILKYSEFLDSI